MTRKIGRLLGVAGVAATLALVGCKSDPDPVEPPDDPPPVVETTPPPAVEEPPKRMDAEGNPVDLSGNPLSRTFYFDFDQATLSQRDLAVLQMHAEFLRDFSDRSVVIEGHCDERGTREYNLALGERRSGAVEGFLTSSGVRASQVDSVSYGEERPADPGHDESAWSRNRRAELIYR